VSGISLSPSPAHSVKLGGLSGVRDELHRYIRFLCYQVANFRFCRDDQFLTYFSDNPMKSEAFRTKNGVFSYQVLYPSAKENFFHDENNFCYDVKFVLVY